MPGHRTTTVTCRIVMLLGLACIIFRLVVPAKAEVVNFSALLPFVNMKIPGWTMQGKPSGTTMQQGKGMLSEARVSFRAGDQTLEVIIMDFLGKTIPFLTGQHQPMECIEETVRLTEVQGFKAVETLRREDKLSELNISVADRFWVKIDGEGIDNIEVLTKVAQQMNLKKLAALAK